MQCNVINPTLKISTIAPYVSSRQNRSEWNTYPWNVSCP